MSNRDPLTLSGGTEAFIAAIRNDPKTKTATVDFYRFALAGPVKNLGDRAIADLTAIELQPHVRSVAQYVSIRRLFRWLCKTKAIAADPSVGIESPPRGVRVRTLSRRELVSLLFATPSRAFRRALILLYHLGCRPGELRLLRWDEVDLARRRIVLTTFKARDRRRDGVKHRVILLDDQATAMLTRLMRRLKPAPHDPVLRNVFGSSWSANAFRCQMRRARKKAGLGDVVCYTLRHTRATELLSNGAPDAIVAEMLGHTDTRTTRRYLHPSSNDCVRFLHTTSTAHRRGRVA